MEFQESFEVMITVLTYCIPFAVAFEIVGKLVNGFLSLAMGDKKVRF